MKKLVSMSVLFGIVILLLLLAAGPAAAAPPQQIGRPGGGDGGVDVVGGAGVGTEAEPGGTALRINFEVGGHRARRGQYVVRYPGGDALASWYAHEGATDSGWINGIEISRPTIWVEVVYYPDYSAAPTLMRIMNPAPGTAYGWVSQGMAHSIEVAWPDMQVMPADSMPVMPDGHPWPTYGMPVRPPYAMAQAPYRMMPWQFGMPGGPGWMPGRPPGSMPGRPPGS